MRSETVTTFLFPLTCAWTLEKHTQKKEQNNFTSSLYKHDTGQGKKV